MKQPNEKKFKRGLESRLKTELRRLNKRGFASFSEELTYAKGDLSHRVGLDERKQALVKAKGARR